MATHSHASRILVGLALLTISASASAQEIRPVASFHELTTGNGHGFQVYDDETDRVTAFLEYPTMFVRPGSRPEDQGVMRRDLAWDVYFGVRAGDRAIWLPEAEGERARYVEQTNVIRATHRIEGVTAHSHFFSPFGFEGNAMVMLLEVEGDGTEVSAFALENFHMGEADFGGEPSSSDEAIEPSPSGGLVETGPGGGAMIYLPIGPAHAVSCSTESYGTVRDGGDLDGERSCRGDDRVAFLQGDLGVVEVGDSEWWGVVVIHAHETSEVEELAARWGDFLDGRPARALLDDTLDEWEAWRRPIPERAVRTEDERHLWRQSEAMLRMSQVREPFTDERRGFGMILSSLPPGGWHSAYSRDAMYGLVALARSGHFEEARAGLEFFLDSGAGIGAEDLPDLGDYCVAMTGYYGDGSEELLFNHLVNPAIEVDSWGLYLWAARTYISESGDVDWLRGTTRSGEVVYEAIRGCVAEALAGYLEPSGIVRPDNAFNSYSERMHLLYTTAAAGRGFCDMSAMASELGRDDDAARYLELHQGIAEAIPELFVDERGALCGSIEVLGRGGVCRDGVLVEVLNWGLVDPLSPLGETTLDDLDRRLTTGLGGWSRFSDSADLFDFSEWPFLDLRASSALRAEGSRERADELLDWVTAQAAINHHAIPEIYNVMSVEGELGAYEGAVPMVGFGAGASMMALLDRAGRRESQSCEAAPTDGDADTDAGVSDADLEPDADPDAGDAGDADLDPDAGDAGPPDADAEASGESRLRAGCGCGAAGRRGVQREVTNLVLFLTGSHREVRVL